jgi:hypothetical protein
MKNNVEKIGDKLLICAMKDTGRLPKKTKNVILHP